MNITKIKSISAVISSAFLLLPFFAQAATSTLWDFDDPANSGHNWNGWIWYSRTDTVPNLGGTGASSYGNNGWLKSPNHQQRPSSYDGVGIMSGQFVKTNLPPTNPNSVFQTSNDSDGTLQWLWWHGDANTGLSKNLGELGLADSTSNRMSFYGYLHGLLDSGNETGTNGSNNLNLGTYLYWSGGSCGDVNESCKAHYYHYFNVPNDIWIHFQPDNHPNWQRNNSSQPVEPAGSSHPYFASMSHYYLQTSPYTPTAAGATITLGDITLWSQTNAENDASICNMWVGYKPATNKWEIGFGDCSIAYNNASSGELGGKTKFEARWSTAPITNANWASVNTITPENFRFGSTNSFRRSNDWYPSAWTRFSLPGGTESVNNKLYFAVKDTSSTADGDYHNAPSSNVKTIDYIIRPDGGTIAPDTTPPAAPTGLRPTLH